jgi:hypothetical protein
VTGVDADVTPRLEAGLTVVVVAGASTVGVTSSVLVVVVVFGDGTTTPDEGKETTPIEDVSVGPCG